MRVCVCVCVCIGGVLIVTAYIVGTRFCTRISKW